MATLEDQLKDLSDRLTALENKPANKLSEDDLKKAMEDHPTFRAMGDFIAKWGKNA
jgi:hypothetical protein